MSIMNIWLAATKILSLAYSFVCAECSQTLVTLSMLRSYFYFFHRNVNLTCSLPLWLHFHYVHFSFICNHLEASSSKWWKTNRFLPFFFLCLQFPLLITYCPSHNEASESVSTSHDKHSLHLSDISTYAVPPTSDPSETFDALSLPATLNKSKTIFYSSAGSHCRFLLC